MYTIDWAATGSMLSGIGTIAIPLVAFLGLFTWKNEIIGKRKIELAENIITQFYIAQDKISFARNGTSFEGEGEFKTTITEEAKRRYAFSMYTPAKRLIDENDFFGELSALKFRCKTLFGKETEKAFDDILRARRKVINASQAVTRAVTQDYEDRKNQKEFLSKMRSNMWEEYIENGEDEVKKLVSDAVILIESILGQFVGNRLR